MVRTVETKGRRRAHAESPWTRTQIAHLAASVASDRQQLVAKRRRFHAAPDLGWREFETTKVIVEELSGLRYEVTSGRVLLKNACRLGLSDEPVANEGDTGCFAVLDSGRPGPAVCLRVDIHALPIFESKDRHRPAE